MNTALGTAFDGTAIMRPFFGLCEADEKRRWQTPQRRSYMKEAGRTGFSFLEPMKALQVEKLPEGDWLYEVKLDGYRALAFKNGKEVRLVSRNQKSFNYPQLLDVLKMLPAKQVILDGEIAALDEKGRCDRRDC